jgi:hypothetical protein
MTEATMPEAAKTEAAKTDAPIKDATAEAATIADAKDAAPAQAEAAKATPASWFAKGRTTLRAALPENRAAVLAAGFGFAAGAGLLLGAVALMGIGDLRAAQTPAPTTPATPAPWASAVQETRALKQTIGKLESQVADLKAGVHAANKRSDAQRAQSAERAQNSARTQAEMQARLAKIGDAVERLERRVVAAASAEVTGSVAPPYAAAAAGAAQPHAEEKTPPKPPIASDWVIRDVFQGRALVANRRGVFEAAPGLRLPGLGRVESVTREKGRWVVTAEKGIITTMRRPRTVYGYEAD